MLNELSGLMALSGMSGIEPMGEAGILAFCSGASSTGVFCVNAYGAYCNTKGTIGQTCTAGAKGAVCQSAADAGVKCLEDVTAVSCSPSNQAAFCYNVVGVIQC